MAPLELPCRHKPLMGQNCSNLEFLSSTLYYIKCCPWYLPIGVHNNVSAIFVTQCLITWFYTLIYSPTAHGSHV